MPARENFFGPWNRSESAGLIRVTDIPCANMNGLSKTAPSSPRHSPFISRTNSPLSSPQSTSPPNQNGHLGQLRRNFSSTFMLIPEDREIDIRSTPSPPPLDRYAVKPKNRNSFKKSFVRLLLGPVLLFSMVINIIFLPFKLATTPAFWLSAFLWIFWKILSIPLAVLKYILVAMNSPFSERYRKKRTVLISCGNTIQSLHLARNFYRAGARVVVFEFEGLFGLARFSTAVDKFYTIPKVTPYNVNDYIAAVCNIVNKEKPSVYIPVSATNPAYYDALVRPHLELLGCTSFIPGAQETTQLDDILEVMRNCENNQIPVPPYRVINSKEDLFRLYDSGWLSNFRNVMIATGFNGIIERTKYILPRFRQEFRLTHEISEEKPWIVLRDVPGKHYVTSTTVKDSNVVANVTCSVIPGLKNLISEENEEIDNWLSEFFSKVRFQRPINGHFSFRFVKSDASKNLLALGSRVGVTLGYICYTPVQSKILCKPCKHFSRHNSGPIVQKGGSYWLPEALINTFRNPSKKSIEKFIGTMTDKREALFVYWDPLPYCAYYHFQLPLKSISKFLRRRQTNPCRIMPVH